MELICQEVETKTAEEVEAYAKVFWARKEELSNWPSLQGEGVGGWGWGWGWG